MADIKNDNIDVPKWRRNLLKKQLEICPNEATEMFYRLPLTDKQKEEMYNYILENKDQLLKEKDEYQEIILKENKKAWGR